jgi:hypothetical protein
MNGQLRFGDAEGFAASLYLDPGASAKENGLDIGIDIEYQGAIYAKAGIESFAELPGNYFDLHAAVGPRFTIGNREAISFYTGFRGGVVFRNGANNPIAGVEGGVDYVFPSGIFAGVNGSYIYRGDMKAMGWPEIWRENFYLRIGYKWNWKN